MKNWEIHFSRNSVANKTVVQQGGRDQRKLNPAYRG